MFHQEQKGRVHQERATHENQIHKYNKNKFRNTQLLQGKKSMAKQSTILFTCPVKRGVSAASFDATGLGVRTGQVYIG